MRCSLFERGVSLTNDLLHVKENIKWSSVTKRRNRYQFINEYLKLIFEEWIIKNPSTAASPISRNTI